MVIITRRNEPTFLHLVNYTIMGCTKYVSRASSFEMWNLLFLLFLHISRTENDNVCHDNFYSIR